MAIFTIELQHVRLFAGHGVFPAEQIAGNEFELNLSMVIKVPAEKITTLSQTINYAEVHRITKEIFSAPQALLETVATDVADAIKKAFPALKEISVQIIKSHPPIPAFTGSVSVTYRQRYT